MKFLTSKELSLEKYDALVANDSKNTVFCYSWYLNATCETWGAIVDEAYSFVMPLPYKNRIFFKQVFQHPFSRNIDFFGDESLFPQAIEVLNTFLKIQIHYNGILPLSSSKRVYQVLKLNDQIAYKKNSLRILAKNEGRYDFKWSLNYKVVLDFYLNNSFHKIKQQAKNKTFLAQLMQQALLHEKGECLEVWENDQPVAAAYFLKDKHTVCYLIGDADAEHKKEGVMFSLMHEAIIHYQAAFEIFDFGGSNIESVATFYRKMGGLDQEYFEYKK
jgi:hypothetical protein